MLCSWDNLEDKKDEVNKLEKDGEQEKKENGELKARMPWERVVPRADASTAAVPTTHKIAQTREKERVQRRKAKAKARAKAAKQAEKDPKVDVSTAEVLIMHKIAPEKVKAKKVHTTLDRVQMKNGLILMNRFQSWDALSNASLILSRRSFARRHERHQEV